MRGRAKAGRRPRFSLRVERESHPSTGTPAYRHCGRARNRDENKGESQMDRLSRSSQRMKRKAILVPARLPVAATGGFLSTRTFLSLHRPSGARKPGPFGSLLYFFLCFSNPQAEARTAAGLTLLSPSLPFSVSARAVAFSARASVVGASAARLSRQPFTEPITCVFVLLHSLLTAPPPPLFCESRSSRHLLAST